MAGQLDSWKEIAAHLNRSVRPVRRWEGEEGLPVHRLQHEKGAPFILTGWSWTPGGNPGCLM